MPSCMAKPPAWKPSTAARRHLSRDPISSLVGRCLV
jgi:hypothetical protein